MRRLMKVATTLLLVVMLGGCAAGKTSGWVEASAWGANYTEDFIFDFWIRTIDGNRTGVGSTQLAEFSRGGTTGRICCGLMPGVGETVRVVWRVGGRQELESEWKTFSREVVVAGEVSESTSRHSYLIVRFFPDREVEAEFIPGDHPQGARNPRVDKLFFAGPRVMRQKGD
ncbi:MAG: hypothetical protein INH06_29995 [Cupriavidus sp.]|nr:hypothetical protein [Cupriavidus sp.]